jgi:hypothetical protein
MTVNASNTLINFSLHYSAKNAQRSCETSALASDKFWYIAQYGKNGKTYKRLK